MLDRNALKAMIDAVPMRLRNDPDFREFAAALYALLPDAGDGPKNDTSASERPLLAYCDGSSLGNPGAAGWAVVFATNGDPDKPAETFSNPIEGEATNQIAEILAALWAVRNAPGGRPLEIRTDSRYVVGTMTQAWRRKANHKHWQALDAAIAEHGAPVTFTWVRGHDGNKLQELADKLARQAADCIPPR